MSDSPKFHVVFLATSTEEKVRDFNIVAENNHLPVKFFNMGDLINDLEGVLHNTLEDGGSADENAQKKLLGIAGKLEQCRNAPVAVEQFCRKRGIASYSPERIWFGTEDSGITMPKSIWSNISDDILAVLPEEVRARLSTQTSGPAVETAPFLSATLGAGNLRKIMEAGLSNYVKANDNFASLSELQFTEESVLKLQPMLPKIEEEQAENGEAMRRETFPILTACGQATNNYAHSSYISPDAVGGKPSNYDLIAPRSRNPNHTTAAELGDEYIACHSSRARALDDLQRKINGHVSEEHQLNVATGNARYDLLTNIATDPQAFNVGIVNLDNAGSVTPLMDRLEDQGKHLQPCIPTPNEDPPAGATDIEKAIFYLSYPERLLENSDGLVLLPDSTRASGSKMSLEEKLYILQSIVVAKQLIPRDKHKPVVIVNTDHSWDDAIRIHTALAQCQMTKDHVLPLAYKLPDVNVTANGYFSVINGGQDKYEAALAGAAFIMKDKSLSYHRVASLPNKTSQEGTSPYARDYEQHYRKNQVAIFCSASSENAPLNHFVSDISRKLVAAGKSIICGGGDRYTMGAILEGVEKYRDSFGSKLAVKERKKTAYIAGISTYPIAAAETNSGKMPEEYSYRELATNIYERMAKMMVSAETVLVAPGGAGTIQEWMGFNLLKKKMPTLFSNKKLVIFDPDLLTNPEHRVIGEPATETSSLQNRVFDGVLDIIFDGKTNQHRFSSQYNRTGTFVVSKVDEVVESCLALERSR